MHRQPGYRPKTRNVLCGRDAARRFMMAPGLRGAGSGTIRTTRKTAMRRPIAAAALLAFAGSPQIASAQELARTAAAMQPEMALHDRAGTQPAQPPNGTAGTRTDSVRADDTLAGTASEVPAGTSVANGVPLAPVVVTAARGPQSLTRALPQTTVFDRQDIEDSGATDVAGLLALAPGVQITRNGGPGAVAGLMMRGASTSQALVMIDGVRVESAGIGATQIAQIPLDQLDHVEVVNGNVSALYGSNALGGVVQIFTRDGGNHPPRFTLDSEYGSYHTQRQHAGVNGALDASGDTTFSFDVSRFKTDGFSAINPNQSPVNPNANGTFNESVSASVKHKFGLNWDAGVRYFQVNAKTGFDNPFSLPTDLNDEKDRVGQLSAFVNGKLTDRWSTHLSVAQGTDRSQILLNGAETSRYNTTNNQINWQNDYAIATGHTLLFGYDHVSQELDSTDFSAPVRHVHSGYVGYNGDLGANQLQVNLRRDQYSDFGGANSYFIGYGYNFDAHWKAIVNYSDAFRAPSFDDLYFPFSGDPNLQPERAHSIEAALQYASPAVGVVRLTAFQTRYTNLIQYTVNAAGLFVAQNVGRAKVQGLETSWNGHIGKTDVRATFTVQNPVDEVDDQDLTRRPRRFATFSANRRIGGWRVGGEWLVSGERNDSGHPLGGYGVVNLSARYDITKSWYVAARVENLFNKGYETVYTYNTPRRGAYVTVGWQQQ
jgi:vitamin B12 transporter